MKKDIKQIIDAYRKYVSAGEPMDAVILRLHEEGISFLDSMKVIRAIYGVNLAEAKKKVSEHPVWYKVAHTADALVEEIMMLGPEAAYGDWLEVYRYGFSQRGRLQISTDPHLLKEVESLLESANCAEREIQRALIQRFVEYSDEIVNVLILLLYEHDTSLWGLIIATLHAIGFPRNAPAIPWLIDIAIDPHPIVLNEVIATLKDMDPEAVIPYFTAILLNRDDENEIWSVSVTAVCRLLLYDETWIVGCGPSVAYLLAQNDYKPDNSPDKGVLLSVLEALLPVSGTYALPAIYRVAHMEGESAVGKKAKEIIDLFSEKDRILYQYRLEDL